MNNIEIYKIEKIHRSKIKNSSYNPRVISDDNRKRLKKSLKSLGLLYPLVWNRTTGNLVCGHQRISIIDELMGTDNYELTMSVVELSEKEEVKANVKENNHNLRGDYDSEKILNLFSQGFLPDELGFTINDLNIMEIDVNVDFFTAETKQTEKDVDKIKEMKEARKKYKEEVSKEFAADNFLCIIFKDAEEKTNWLNDNEIDETIKYLSFNIIKSLIKKA